MAVAFDAIGANGATGSYVSNGATLTWNHTCTAGAVLVVGVIVGVVAAPDNRVTTVTYGTTPRTMTSLGRVHNNNQAQGVVELFYLSDPATGSAQAVTVTTNAASTSVIAGSISFTGVLGVGAALEAVGSNSTTAVTSVTMAYPGTGANNMIVNVMGTGATAPVPASSNTSRWYRAGDDSSAGGNGGQSTATSTNGTVTMAYTAGPSDWYGMVAVELLDTAPAGVQVDGVGTHQSAVSTGTASISTTPTLPPGTNINDRVYIVTSNVPATTTPTTPTGWTLVDSQSLGTGTLGAAAGPRRTSVYYRDYDGAWTMPTVTLPSAVAPAMLTQSITLSKSASARWAAPVSTFGSDVTVTTTPYSATGGATVPFAAGDLALVTYVGPGLSTVGSETLTATGATFGPVSHRADTTSTAATNGLHHSFITAPVTAGLATAAPVTGATVSTSGQSDGGSIFIKQSILLLEAERFNRARFRATCW